MKKAVVSRKTVVSLLIAFFVFCIARIIPQMPSEPSVSSVEPSHIEIIQTATEMTEEQAQKILDILQECEITRLDSMTFFDARENGVKVYEIESGNKGFVIALEPDGTVAELYVIRSMLPELVLDGVVKFKVSDLFITDAEKWTLITETESYLKGLVLLSPSTAKFPFSSEWKLAKDFDKNYLTVSSYVDTQNAFGATIREHFTVGYQLHGAIADHAFTLVYIKFGDEILFDIR